MCAEEIRNKLIEGGIAIWTGSGFDKGPNFDTFLLEMELSKAATGEYHPHLAHSLFTKYLVNKHLYHLWKKPARTSRAPGKLKSKVKHL